MLVASRLKTAAALCALLAVAALQPGAVSGDAVVAADVVSMDMPPEGEDDSHDEPQPADPTPAPEAPTDAPTPVSTPVPGPHDTPETPDYEWYWKHGEASMFSQDSPVFKTFKPNDTDQTCSQDTHATPFNKQVRGVNLGGWLVLEPWITPTLFYQFLNTQQRFGDKAPEKTAMDLYTFCTSLGKEEANRQLRVHYDNWVSEKDIAALAAAGINSMRVPVGDWMFNPYEPYSGCTDGALEALDRVADLAVQYDIEILLDIHGLIGSQNGFDNSGKSSSVKWTSIASTQPVGTTTFEHWPIRQAEWAGTFDVETHNYTSINYANLNHSIVAVEAIINRYKGHKAIIGLEPVNEPWELTPIEVLKEYYWKSYKRVKALAPTWKFVIHDSFRFGLSFWADFLKGCPDIALDTHIYQAWNPPGTIADFFSNACQQKYVISDMENAMMPVIVGEWSIGTDNCAMWLNGFNDNLPGFPKTKPIQGPYGTGMSGPSFGKCPVTSDNSFDQPDDAALTRSLTLKKLNAFAVGHGWYFWNFKTEFATKWSFLDLVRLGMFPKNVSDYHESEGVESACRKEDRGEFVCRAKRGVQEFELKSGLAFACNFPEIDCKDIKKRFLTLEEQCDWAFNQYWHLNREKGATCDFGGAAHLLNVPGSAPTQLPAAVPAPTPEKIKEEKPGHLLVSVAKWSIAAILGFVALAFAAVAAAIFAVVRWRQNRMRRQYSPIGSRV
ncbi:putative glucan 1,3-beta-glucosidase [Phytophthora cinnamomi]|uniref:putative glucan 1,3-beta-glucosidase n=1 Tax=Phytophthora cinnamomi TaxID=4785 RepID=UPI00355A9692|nr:putative glucan 1,3-beta-glucosidase [Phytophthora cinnamomi]